MELLIAIVIGGIVGWLASIVMKTNEQMGILANGVVGILGSALGHWLAPKFGIEATNRLGNWIVSVAGAALLILLLKGFGFFRRR